MAEPVASPSERAETWHERLELAAARLPPSPSTIAAGVVAVAAMLLIGWFVLRQPPAPPPELVLPVAGGASTGGGSTTTAPAAVVVHAAGAVRTPGVYRLPPGARVADVLDAAGGPSGDADLDRLNLAAPVVDGSQVYVPRVGEPMPPGSVAGGAGGDAATGPLDLNTATKEQLEALPGVGPATAAAILAERDRRGSFSSVDDLLDVRGIGPAKLAGLRDLVTV